MNKLKIAIYEFTDCEGCQVEIISLREQLLALENRVDIAVWRLGQEKKEKGPFDIAIIEGTPVSQDEIDLLKSLRENSKTLVGLGSCATLGGIPAIMPKSDRKIWYEKIYNPSYQPRAIDALPLSAFVKVDFSVHGCPIERNELVRIVEELLSGKNPSYREYSVCFECKMANNPCRITEGKKPCLGPITQGGCKAICVSGGSPCYGCFGLREEANISGLLKILEKITDKEEIKRYLSMFHNRTKEITDRKK
jgi:coenzyme F420-reducing hydrogenase gamma subunit